MFNYNEYASLFNKGDDVAHTERYFSEDVKFITAGRTLSGKAELYKFLEFAHDGVLERMRPQKILHQEDCVFAEIDMDFYALKARPDFPFAPLMPGDMITVKFFVTYKTRGDKVVELKSMTWPAERGVSKIPKLGAHPSQQAAFRAYLAAFSSADCERFPAYYQEDIVLHLGGHTTLQGKQAIADFYRIQTATVRENVEVLESEFTDTAIRVVANARFTAIADAPSFVLMPLLKGEGVLLSVVIHYELKDGLIQSIRTERLAELSKIERSIPA